MNSVFNRVQQSAARLLSSTHAYCSANPDNAQHLSIMSGVAIEDFTSMSKSDIERIGNSKTSIFCLHNVKCGLSNTTGLSALLDAIETKMYSTYEARLASVASIEVDRKADSTLNCASSALLISLHSLAQAYPALAQLYLMCTSEEIRRLAQIDVSDILEFTMRCDALPFYIVWPISMSTQTPTKTKPEHELVANAAMLSTFRTRAISSTLLAQF